MFKTKILAAVVALMSAGAAMADGVDYPTGFWVVTGTACDAKNPAGIRIEDDSITMYDPGVRRIQSSSDGTSSITDLSTQITAITSVEKIDDSYHFLATLAEDQGTLDLTFVVSTNGDALVTIPSKGSIPLVACPG